MNFKLPPRVKDSKEFKEFAYTRESLQKSEDLYKRVVNGQYTEIAAEIEAQATGGGGTEGGPEN